jgi:hypothetical protein
MLASTGRNSRVRHSTAEVGDHAMRRNHCRPRPPYSTGREGTVNHFTGAPSNVRRDEERAQAEAEQGAG